MPASREWPYVPWANETSRATVQFWDRVLDAMESLETAMGEIGVTVLDASDADVTILTSAQVADLF